MTTATPATRPPLTPLQQVLNAARSKVGTIEAGGADGHSGNIVWAWDWWEKATKQKEQGQPWCGASVSWSFAQAGASSLIAATNSSGFIYCPDGVKFFKSRKMFLPARLAQPGDVVFFDFSGKGNAEHVGIILSNHNTYLVTVEGNTSPEHSTGSQANGGGQYLRNRAITPSILGVGRPDWQSLGKAA